MASDPMNTVIQQIRDSVRSQDEAHGTDAELLTHFLEHRDETAFAALVRRHGSMVMGVCRRVARDHHDAEDAFQATFLILVRKAASIGSRELIANWLYGVAYDVALKARAVTMKRRFREQQRKPMPEPAIAAVSTSDDLREVLDRELSRLPAKYRIPIVLCDLEGKTRKEAAAIAGCPEGSLSSRLARARDMLARRLMRHGLAVSSGALAALLAHDAALTAAPPSIVAGTIRTAMLIANGQATAGVLSPNVAAVMEGALKAMLLTRLKTAMLAVAVGLIVLAAAGSAYEVFTMEPTDGNPLLPVQSPPVPKQAGAPANAGEKAMQGTWMVDCAERYGLTFKNVSGEFVMQDKVNLAFPISPEVPNRVVVSGSECALEYAQGPGRTLVQRSSITLDATRKPKWITLTGPDGDITCGIYAFDGEALRMCWQCGQRRNLRPTDFNTKKDGDREDDLEVWVLKKLTAGATGKPAPKDESKPVPIQQSWDGILGNRNQLKDSPAEGFVAEAESWTSMWKSWRGKEPVPAIDFDNQMVLIFTVPGANRITPPALRLDRDGNLRVPLPVSTLLPDDGTIGYKIVVINRAGVLWVNGRSLHKGVKGAL
jgi:RNA polymerase sigma factor (sigma-70 family)